MQTAPQTESGQGLVAALVAGVAGWMLVSLAWLAWLFARGGELGLFAVAAPFWAWSVGYLPGVAALLLYAGLQAARRRLSLSAALRAAAIYLLPVFVAGAAFRLFLAGQPTSVSQGDAAMMMAAFGAPIFFLLYLVGLGAGFRARRRPLAATVRAFMIPPAAGVVLAAAYFGVFTLRSPQWQARDTLVLHVAKVDWRVPQGLFIDAELEVKRDYTAVFHAFYRDRTGKDTGRGEPVRALAIGAGGTATADEPQAWTRTALALRAGARYPVRMEWPNLEPRLQHSKRKVYLRVVEGDRYHSGTVLREFALDVDPDTSTMAALDSRLLPAGPTGRVGYVTPSGVPVIPGRFEWGDEFSEGLALVRIDGRFGYIDPAGTLVIPARFESASRFSEGLAAVREMPGGTPRAGYVDRSGATAIEFAFEAAHPFSEGLARVRSGGREGYIDRSGRFVISPRWEWAYDFAGGLAPVKVGERWGFIDAGGKMILEPQFEALQPFQQGRWNVMRDRRWGPVDPTGRWSPD